MVRKSLLPIYTLSSLFVVVSCGDSSSHSNENLRGQAFPVTENDGFAQEGDEVDATALDPQLAEFSRVNESQTAELQGELAEALSQSSPMSQLLQSETYLVSLQPLKDDPQAQFITHLYCFEKSEHFSQCIVFDGNNEQANLIGVKYVISSEAFELLPAEEREYWHPQNYSILSGQLIAPGRSDEDEQELMSRFMNSYAKSWQTWNGIQHEVEADPIPLGEAQLAWSFAADGQAREGLIEHRDQQLNVNTEERRDRRQDLVDLAQAQCGFDLLADDFDIEIEYIPGVEPRGIEECYGNGVAQPEQENGEPTAPNDKAGVPEAEEPGEEPVDEPAEENGEEPVEEPAAEEPGEEPIEEPAEEPANGQTDEPVGEEPVEQVENGEAAEEGIVEPVDQEAEQQNGQDQAEEPAEEPVDEEPTDEEPADDEEPTDEEPAEEPGEEPTDDELEGEKS